MFIHRLKIFLFTVLAVIFSLLIGCGIKVVNLSRLSSLQGDRTFFLDSASSQGLMKKQLSLVDLSRVKGESISFFIDVNDGGRYALSEEIIKSFNAKILFIEETAGVTSYYCYTPLWQDGLLIKGQSVNLHVAVSVDRCTVGTPIIFGGF